MEIGRNLKFSVRQMHRAPGFTATVVLTLALSIGANTAIFSLMNALLLKNLPYPDPERIAAIYTRITGNLNSDSRSNLDGEKWELLRDNVRSLISAVSGQTAGVNLVGGSQVKYVREGRVSAHYFDVLQLQPAIGRNFTEEDDRPGAPQTTILSYSLWRELFNGDPLAVGHTVMIKGVAHTVIGVLPSGAALPEKVNLYTALQPSRKGEGEGGNYEVIARLREGATWQQANDEINHAWSQRAERFAENNPGARVSYYSVPLQKAQTEAIRPQILALMLSAGLILLIACANLAGLMLVRMQRRSSEVAMRMAIGASRWQIQKQFWTEAVVLALSGGTAALGIGTLCLRGFITLFPPDSIPEAALTFDWRVLLFTLSATLATSVLFGILPALSARAVDLSSRIGSRTIASGTRVFMRHTLAAAQIAVTVVLLAAAGLLIRNLVHLAQRTPGFNPDGVLIAKASLDDLRFHDAAKFRKLLAETTAEMAQIPGVQSAAVGLTVPYERPLNEMIELNDGKEAGQEGPSDLIYVTPGYFQTLQIPLLTGRLFTDADGPDTEHVAVVNQSFAKAFYGGASPIGRYVNAHTRIVGQVPDLPVSSGINPTAPLMSEPAVFIPAAQFDARSGATVHVWFQPDFLVRVSSESRSQVRQQIQSAISRVDPNLPVAGFFDMNDLLAKTLSLQRIEVGLLGSMSALALLLSAVGISGLVANLVTQRTREMGIRMALGSSVRQAVIEVGRSGLKASFVGLAVGLVLCGFVLRVLRSVLYGIGTYDPATIITVVFTVLLVAFVATLLPALRIARVDPASTLREQ